MNVAFYIGTNFDLEGFKTKIINNMGSDYDVIVAKRFAPPLGLTNPKAREEHILADPVFSGKPSREDVLAAERKLGVPFRLLLRYWYNWDEKNERNEGVMWGHYSLMTQYFLFWQKFFKSNGISVFVTTFESTFPEIISVKVAGMLGIKVIFIYGARLSNAVILYDGEGAPIYWKTPTAQEREDTCAMLRDRYLSRKEAENVTIQKDVERLTDYSMRNVLYKLGRLASYWKNYYAMPGSDRMRTISPYQLVRKYLVGQARQYYASLFLHGKPPYEGKDYFLFPLQFADEVSTSYQEAFLDQAKLIGNISRCLPIGHALLVKPHPHWKSRDIPISKMQELKRLPNVHVVRPDANTYRLIQGAKAVLTVSSTPGFEALALGKQVVTFGHDPLYAKNRAMITVYDMNELPGVMMKLAAGDVIADERAAKDMLATYYKHMVPFEGTWGMNSVTLTASDEKRIAGAIGECIAAVTAGKRR